jgi:hypothetical protein
VVEAALKKRHRAHDRPVPLLVLDALLAAVAARHSTGGTFAPGTGDDDVDDDEDDDGIGDGIGELCVDDGRDNAGGFVKIVNVGGIATVNGPNVDGCNGDWCWPRLLVHKWLGLCDDEQWQMKPQTYPRCAKGSPPRCSVPLLDRVIDGRGGTESPPKEGGMEPARWRVGGNCSPAAISNGVGELVRL